MADDGLCFSCSHDQFLTKLTLFCHCLFDVSLLHFKFDSLRALKLSKTSENSSSLNLLKPVKLVADKKIKFLSISKKKISCKRIHSFHLVYIEKFIQLI